LPSAVTLAEKTVESLGVPAHVLSACINILAAQAEQAPDDQFEAIAERVFAWCQRLDEAADRDEAGPSLLALSYFNRGLLLLRSGWISRAQQAFKRAKEIYPEGPMIEEMNGLETYDRHAREVAQRVRATAEQFPTKPVAA
jgi:hypothetical protein